MGLVERTSQCSPDGLLKGQITQRGHSSLRSVWSQRNSGGIGGLHSSVSSPSTHPPAPSASLRVRLSTGLTAIPHCSLARDLETSLSSLVYLVLLLYLFSFLSYFILALWMFFLSLQCFFFFATVLQTVIFIELSTCHVPWKNILYIVFLHILTNFSMN